MQAPHSGHEGEAVGCARRLLGQIGARAPATGPADPDALAWRRSGLMEITGWPGEPGRMCPAPIAAAADGALIALKAIAGPARGLPTHGALLLGERARILGLTRAGRVSANGACRLIDASDGRIALNLARPDDWDLVPVLLDCVGVDSWDTIATQAAALSASPLVARGVELGLPIALDQPPSPPERLFDPLPAAQDRTDVPLVLDLSPLWAGPLAASLLAILGARVVKVESARRLDGARFGNAAFFDLLNAAKESVVLDFGDPVGRRRLHDLVRRADIVVEGSRPRALRQLGVEREAVVARGGVWVSITAYPDPDRAGFGDDAGVSAGLSTLMEEGWAAPSFVGDAVADPLTGLHAAFGAWAAWLGGAGGFIGLALSDVVGHAIGMGIARPPELRRRQALAEADVAPLYPLRESSGGARPAGADTESLFER